MITLKQTLLATAAASVVYVKFAPAELRYFSNDKITVALFFFVATLIKLFHALFLWPFLLSPLRKLPGPKTESYINGHLPSIAKYPTGVPQEQWIKIPNDGLITYKYIFNTERVMPTTPAAMAEVTVHKAYEFEKPWFMKQGIANLLGPKGLFFTEGDEHKFQRKHMAPAFSLRYLKQNIIPIFWSCSTTLIDRLIEDYKLPPTSDSEESSFSEFIDMQEWCSRCTLDIIGQAGFGVDFNSMHKDGSELARAYSFVFSNPGKLTALVRMLSFVMPTEWFYGLISWVDEIKTFEKSLETVRQASRGVITRKKEEIKKAGGRDAVSNGNGKNKNLLSIIMEEMDFPDETLVDQTLTFLAAGHETTSTALTWAIIQLIAHPEWQSLLRAEIRTHIPSPTHSDLIPDMDHLPLLKAFTSELLRFNSPVSLMFRETIHDLTIAGHPVPKGTIVTLPINAFNLDIDCWGPTAKTFDPYRWLKKNPKFGQEGQEEWSYDPSGGSKSNYAFMTFFQGPHSCIGKDFAREEFILILAALVGRFEFVGDGKVPKIDFSITNKVKDGLMCKIRWVAGW